MQSEASRTSPRLAYNLSSGVTCVVPAAVAVMKWVAPPPAVQIPWFVVVVARFHYYIVPECCRTLVQCFVCVPVRVASPPGAP
eukprot:SAG31_NODE_20_length_34168_cov_33.651296_23_plen_83_part_00